jgi:hypothetical protein
MSDTDILIELDERRRASLGRVGRAEHRRYLAHEEPDGTIVFVPAALIPERELIVWENADLRASLFRGLAEAAEGQATRLDWVTADVDADAA